VYLFAIEAAILRGESDDVLQTWKKNCLSVCLEYVDVSAMEDADAAWWWAWNNRETACVTAESVKRTAYQRACEVHEFQLHRSKHSLPSTPEAIAQIYTDKATTKKTVNSGSGVPTTTAKPVKVDASWVRNHLNVYEKICKNADITQVIDALEKKFGTDSCLNSISKLTRIIERGDSVQHRVLIFKAIEDAIERGTRNDKFSRDFLVGATGAVGSSIPFCTLTIFKWQCRHHLLTVEFLREKIMPDDTQTIAAATADYKAYRNMLDSENPQADTSWIGTMKPSSVLALRVVQVRIVAFLFKAEIVIFIVQIIYE
jgi:hypothetical protein